MIPPAGLPTARYVRFDSYREYEDRLDALLPRALAVIRIFENRLSARYNSRARCDLLRAFLRGATTRRLLVVVHDATPIARDCPRLAALALACHTQVEIRRTQGAARLAHDPCLIVDLTHYLHRFHHAAMRAAQGTDDLAGAQALIDRYGEIWAASVPVRPASAAGL